MTYDPTHIAAKVLDNAESVSALSSLEAEDFRTQLWHIIAGFVINHYLGESEGASAPDIDSITDSVLPVVAAALKKLP